MTIANELVRAKKGHFLERFKSLHKSVLYIRAFQIYGPYSLKSFSNTLDVGLFAGLASITTRPMANYELHRLTVRGSLVIRGVELGGASRVQRRDQGLIQ
jgi:hypothetical protein